MWLTAVLRPKADQALADTRFDDRCPSRQYLLTQYPPGLQQSGVRVPGDDTEIAGRVPGRRVAV